MIEKPLTYRRIPASEGRKWGLLVALTMAVFYSGGAALGYENSGFFAGLSVGAIFITIIIRWPLKNSPIFWCLIALYGLAHIPLIVDPPDIDGRYPTVLLALPFGCIDVGLINLIIGIAKRFWMRGRTG